MLVFIFRYWYLPLCPWGRYCRYFFTAKHPRYFLKTLQVLFTGPSQNWPFGGAMGVKKSRNVVVMLCWGLAMAHMAMVAHGEGILCCCVQSDIQRSNRYRYKISRYFHMALVFIFRYWYLPLYPLERIQQIFFEMPVFRYRYSKKGCIRIRIQDNIRIRKMP